MTATATRGRFSFYFISRERGLLYQAPDCCQLVPGSSSPRFPLQKRAEIHRAEKTLGSHLVHLAAVSHLLAGRSCTTSRHPDEIGPRRPLLAELGMAAQPKLTGTSKLSATLAPSSPCLLLKDANSPGRGFILSKSTLSTCNMPA